MITASKNIMRSSRIQIPAMPILFLFWIGFSCLSPSEARGEERTPAGPSEESIAYWKPYEILPEQDPKVREAHEIFKRLLQAWEEARIAPELHVVRSGSGPWAASLEDGAVLLSRQAIDLCLKEEAGGRDRLAFVMAHELAHQRAGHFWHRRLFRLKDEKLPKEVEKSPFPNQLEQADLEAKEIQADQEGLFLMAIVGFQPEAVAGSKNRFFFDWVESIWGKRCNAGSPNEECSKAQNRFETVRSYWEEAIRQSILFDLGNQFYVAGDYATAGRLFTAYGRGFPHREVHNNIGLAHVGKALAAARGLRAPDANSGLGFVYPFILEDGIEIPRERARGGTDDAARLQKEIADDLKEAIHSFERAIKVDPGHRAAYLHLASTYLLSGNAPLAYGVLEGEYVRRFGRDAVALTLLGITAFLEKETDKARMLFDQAVTKAKGGSVSLVRIDRAIFLDAIGAKQEALGEWILLADWAKSQGDGILLQRADQNLNKALKLEIAPPKRTREKIRGYVVGERVGPSIRGVSQASTEEVWIQGEPYQIYRFSDGAHVAVDPKRVISALWQQDGKAATAVGVEVGDEEGALMKIYGVPSRTVETAGGKYLPYDFSGIAFRILDGRVSGWFLYTAKS